MCSGHVPLPHAHDLRDDYLHRSVSAQPLRAADTIFGSEKDYFSCWLLTFAGMKGKSRHDGDTSPRTSRACSDCRCLLYHEESLRSHTHTHTSRLLSHHRGLTCTHTQSLSLSASSPLPPLRSLLFSPSSCLPLHPSFPSLPPCVCAQK